MYTKGKLKCCKTSKNNEKKNYRGDTVQDLVGRMNREVLQRTPNNPHLSPCDFHAVGPLKKF